MMKLRSLLIIILIIVTLPFLTIAKAQPQLEYFQLPGPPPTAKCYIWADNYTVVLDGWTFVYLWWEDVGYSHYYIVVYETYPDGRTVRYPPTGY